MKVVRLTRFQEKKRMLSETMDLFGQEGEARMNQFSESSMAETGLVVTVRNSSRGKAIFLHLSVILFTGEVSASGSMGGSVPP